MNLHNLLKRKVSEFILKKYDLNFNELEVQMTKKDFIGDITIVVFPLVKSLRKSPLEIGNEIGEFLLKELEYVEEFLSDAASGEDGYLGEKGLISMPDSERAELNPKVLDLSLIVGDVSPSKLK